MRTKYKASIIAILGGILMIDFLYMRSLKRIYVLLLILISFGLPFIFIINFIRGILQGIVYLSMSNELVETKRENNRIILEKIKELA